MEITICQARNFLVKVSHSCMNPTIEQECVANPSCESDALEIQNMKNKIITLGTLSKKRMSSLRMGHFLEHTTTLLK